MLMAEVMVQYAVCTNKLYVLAIKVVYTLCMWSVQQGSYKTLQPFFKVFSRTTLDFQGSY